jgi:hypothetical protein
MIRAGLQLALVALLAALAWPRAARAQQDPRLVWRTFETPHFHIHYYQDMEPVARRVGEVAERAAERLHGPLGWAPSSPVDVVLSDDTDDANGSATAIPLNTVRLFVTAPDDLSVLNQYDDWLTTLVTHEYTHILHADHITGVAAIVNLVIGKQWAPNQMQPRWLLEGLAVYEESLHTHGGRLRSAQWDMILRADALAANLVTLDQLSSGPNRWPHGNIWYLYGGYFLQYVAARFGPQALADIAADYGSHAIPWQLNRSVHRATGRTWEELYEDFTASLTARYTQQERALRARGLEEGARLTRQGESVRAPRFLPDGTLVYESTDGQSQTQLRAMSPADLARADALPEARSLDWLAGPSGFGVRDGTSLVVSDTNPHRDLHDYHDLFVWRLARDRDGALSVEDTERITDGWRTQQPDVSPDGDHVVFSVNHRSTTSLFEMSLTDRVPRPLFRPRRFEQVYAPRYAPDGRFIAFSHWRVGGRRDVALYNRETRALSYATDDAALDLSPTFSPDGRWLVFSSDRSGVSNLYARALSRDGHMGPLRQITNVVHGAFQPVVSPDGRTLVYVSYSHRGYDLARMPFDPSRWRDPEGLPDDVFERADADPPAPVTYATWDRAYNPWATLRPRALTAELTADGFGPQLALRLTGADILGRHAWNARVGVGLVRGDPNLDVTYVYRGLRPTMRLRLYRSVDAGTGYRVAGTAPGYIAERFGGESEVSVLFPGRFDTHLVALTYDASYVHAYGGFPGLRRAIDPNEAPPSFPFEGWNAGLRATWSYARVRRYAYSITAQEGVSVFATVRVADPMLGSAVGSIDASAGVSAYIPMPWGVDRRRHILALHFGAGVGASDLGERGLFALGGFPAFNSASLLDALRSGAVAGGIALRGYEPAARVGSQFELFNVEYRFPIVQAQRGLSTLPVFVQRVWGDVFCDVGHAAFGRFDVDNVAVGAGAEAMFDLVLGYVVPITVRAGWAHGFMTDGSDQFYALFGSPF